VKGWSEGGTTIWRNQAKYSAAALRIEAGGRTPSQEGGTIETLCIWVQVPENH